MSKYFLTKLVLASLVFYPSAALAIDRETLGEECTDILHSKEEVPQADKDRCLEKYRKLVNIVITPTKKPESLAEVPASVSVVGPQSIERSAAISLADALKDVPSVEITDAGQAGLKRIRLRGEESRRVKILIDGQEFADQREVGTPLLIAPEMIDRIEVLRGTGSVLHGSRAIGGVVNFITKKGGYHPIQGTLSSQIDSSTEGYQHFLSVHGAIKDFDYRVAGSIAEHEDRDTPEG